MDGINPTLTFLALLLGMTGNSRDAANDTAAALDIDNGSGCPALVIVGDPPQPSDQDGLAGALWGDAATAAAPPDVIDPKWADAAFPEIEVAAPPLQHGSDPIKRYAVPAGSALATDAEGDPCGPER